jgi:hypothetical protein
VEVKPNDTKKQEKEMNQLDPAAILVGLITPPEREAGMCALCEDEAWILA